MRSNVLDNLYNADDRLGVQMYGPRTWNALKARVCGTTAAMLEHPEQSAARPICANRSHDELFVKLFRPDVKAGAELLGGGWVERVEDSTLGFSVSDISNLSDKIMEVAQSDKVQIGADIFHNVANIAKYIPGYGAIVPAARKVTNTAADLLTTFGFGTKSDDVKSAAKTGGTILLLGGAGFAVWYFGFYRKKRRGRR